MPALQTAKKLVIGVIGGTVVLLGVVMLVTPGPGVPAILVGLAILGTEFVWARRMLHKVKEQAKKVTGKKDGAGSQKSSVIRRITLFGLSLMLVGLLLYGTTYYFLRLDHWMVHYSDYDGRIVHDHRIEPGEWGYMELFHPNEYRLLLSAFRPAMWLEERYWNFTIPPGSEHRYAPREGPK